MPHPYIAFESITQTHLLVLTEYHKKCQSLPTQARNCRMKLQDYKSILTTALGLAGEISFFEPKGQAREKLDRFFQRWYAEGHKPAQEPSPPVTPEPLPKFRPCDIPQYHDPEITPRQMDCLRQFVTQQNVVRAAEVMKLPRLKFMREVWLGLYRAAVVCNRRRPATASSLRKVDQIRLIYEYFDTLEAQKITMDDPMF